MRDPSNLVADRDELDVGFRQLAPDLRAILVLHYYVGMTMPTVAETLGIPLGHGPVPAQPGPDRTAADDASSDASDAGHPPEGHVA